MCRSCRPHPASTSCRRRRGGSPATMRTAAALMDLSLSFRFLLLVIILPMFLPYLYAAEDSAHSGRSLMSFKETFGNVTYGCSPAGPCIACRYPEKNDENYRCSETGYRIPLKCLLTADKSTNGSESKGRIVLESSQKQQASLDDIKSRKLLRDSTISDNKEKSYITYRSCVPIIREENLTVLGFEGIMLFMLGMSGSVLYFKRKRSVSLPNGAPVRLPINPRF